MTDTEENKHPETPEADDETTAPAEVDAKTPAEAGPEESEPTPDATEPAPKPQAKAKDPEPAAAEGESPSKAPEATDEPTAVETEKVGPEAEKAAPEAKEAAPEAEKVTPVAKDKAAKDEGEAKPATGDRQPPGAHLEPDIAAAPAESGRRVGEEEEVFARYAEPGTEEQGQVETGDVEPASDEEAEPEPLKRLKASARYRATGKRKTSVARVTLKPGKGNIEVNGKAYVEYFPRRSLQATVRQPLESTGNLERLDVTARIHGGGVSSQASALRHGIARALVEADPELRKPLKRRGALTRDARIKERRKAGLKKARKRPQFSKR